MTEFPPRADELCQSILITDDNQGVRDALVTVLRSQGFVVRGARNGKEALAELRKMPAPTLIFLDLMMPIMDGWQFLEAWKTKHPEFQSHKVVTISAVNPRQKLDAPVPANTVGALQKPLSFVHVLTYVKRFCEQPSTSASSPSVRP